MAARPVVLPDTFSGEGSWTEWKYHFENVAKVNEWNEAKKLQWLRVRLTGRAQTAIHRITGEAAASYRETLAALDERFEPKSRQTRYQAEFQTRRKKKTEGWAEFAEDLKTLADKGFPELSEDAKQQLSLQIYMQQLDHPQVAFSVKQKRPATLDEAVAATIEMESYLPALARVAVAGCQGEDHQVEEAPSAHVATVDPATKLASLVERLVERVEKLELGGSKARQQGYSYGPGSSERRRPGQSRATSGNCWRCGRRGHFARDCRQPPAQGN